MTRMTLLFLLLSLVSPWVQAAQWTGRLQGGGDVQVDPYTNRATVTRNGLETQLWDGAHRLEDGSTITIRSGRIVPNVEILETRKGTPQPWEGALIVGFSPCERLVREVCGAEGQCANHPDCALVKQLLDMEEQEREASASPNRMTYTSGQCQKVLADGTIFASCHKKSHATQKEP